MPHKIDFLSTKNIALIAATVSAAYTQPLLENVYEDIVSVGSRLTIFDSDDSS